MKGPWQRIRYDGRRLWQCPVCGHRHRASGNVTSQLCACQKSRTEGQRAWMKLVDEGFPVIQMAKPQPIAESSPDGAPAMALDTAPDTAPETSPVVTPETAE